MIRALIFRFPRQLRYALGVVVCLTALLGPCHGQGEPADSAAPLLYQAWQQFTAGRFTDAERLYQKAVLLGESTGDAELGLGWSLQRQARCTEARVHFLLVQKRREDAGALQGLAMCPPPRPLLLIPTISQGVYIYRQHPSRDVTSATTVRLAALVHEHWLLSLGYRFSYFAAKDPSVAAWLQHDVYLTAGYTARLVGLSLHYGMLHGALSAPLVITGIAPSDYADTSHHLGATARFSPYGDALLAFAVSIYPTETVMRSELSWWLPIFRGLRIRPTAAVQWSGGALRPSGALTLGYEHRKFGLFAGGKYGPELRPAQLDYEVIYNGPERIPYGLWTGATVRPGAGFTLALAYAYDRLQSDVTDATTQVTSTTSSDAHYLTLSLSKEL